MAKRCGSDQDKKISLEDISSGGGGVVGVPVFLFPSLARFRRAD